MQAGSRWKLFRRRVRYWLDHSERQRLLWEEMEFHVESMAGELIAQGMSEQEARGELRDRDDPLGENGTIPACRSRLPGVGDQAVREAILRATSEPWLSTARHR